MGQTLEVGKGERRKGEQLHIDVEMKRVQEEVGTGR